MTLLVSLMKCFGRCLVLAATSLSSILVNSVWYFSFGPGVVGLRIAIEPSRSPPAAILAAAFPASRASRASTGEGSGQQRWR